MTELAPTEKKAQILKESNRRHPMRNLVVFLLILYIGVCFGLIARRHGKNPWLYGILSVISPLNLFLLGWLAFCRCRGGSSKIIVLPPESR